MSEGELLNRIERELDARQPKDFRLSVLREGVRKEGNWWYVVVKSDVPNIRASRYDSIVRDVEEAIEDDEHENVLLVPALVD